MVVIYQCGARKRTVPMAAGAMYTGPLFKAYQRAAVSFKGSTRFIASAKYGLIRESQVIAPYDQKLPKGGDAVWGARVLEQLLAQTTEAERDTVVALCSADYLVGWATDVRALAPMAGMQLGYAMQRARQIAAKELDLFQLLPQ